MKYWLALLTIEVITPKGGIDPYVVSRKNDEEDEFIQLMLLFITLIGNDE